MMARRIALVVVNLGLLTGTALVLNEDLPLAPPTRAGGAPLPKMPPAIAPQVIPATSRRSLFRLAIAEPPKTASAPSAVAKPRLRLVGIVIAESRPIGLIEQEGAGTRRVSVGDDIASWRVEAIEPRSLRLTREGQQVDYALDPRPSSQ